ncbi:PP2C family protein-serine/threonine phosphatase [Synechococcus sp. A15-60]|uniref:PP2C family protein-serine/threonine phosphatase n=1 Tax=Synechococcus sp. A15-60 TaxID=1050655 RepID=UPI001644F834|nr:PP2C family protein-serine/threonine phosphatase [Synechococcus sp. A15-60]
MKIKPREMLFKSAPSVRQKYWLVIVAACLGALANLHPYELYVNTSLTLGMSIALFTLFVARGWWGFAVAIPAGFMNMDYLGRYYSFIIYMIEMLSLTYFINSRSGNRLLEKGHIIIVGFLFWLLIGAPLHYLAHYFLVGLTHIEAFTLAEKTLLNGVVNILIAFIAYSALALLQNKREMERAAVSIQALTLSTVYSLIVFISLFTASTLFKNVNTMQAKNLSVFFRDQAAYIFDTLSLSSSEEEQKKIIDYMESQNVFFRWENLKSPSEVVSTDNQDINKVIESYQPSSARTPLSRLAAELAEPPNRIRLLMPPSIDKKRLLKKIEMSYWRVRLFNDEESVTIIQRALPSFNALIGFYRSMLNTLIICLMIGIIISVLISLIIHKEFVSVLKTKRTIADSKAQKDDIDEDEDIYLQLSPICEVRELADKVNERTSIIEASKKKIEELNNIAQQQLSTAGEIQQCFLGKRDEFSEKPDVSLFMRPAYNAGGDWYDIFEVNSKTYLVVADVCDKGVGAALFMSVFRSLIRYSAESLCAQNPETNEPLDEVIESVNNYMSTKHADTTMFATVFLACINRDLQQLDYILAGHEHPILLSSKGESTEFEFSGPAIGLFPDATYSIGSIKYDRGSILVGYSDGVVDARNTNNVSYGHERLMELILDLKKNDPDLKAKTITDTLIKELDEHIGEAEQFDDITVVAAIL